MQRNGYEAETRNIDIVLIVIGGLAVAMFILSAAAVWA